MSTKLTKVDGGWRVSVLRRRGKTKLVPVISKVVKVPDRASILAAITEMEAALAANTVPGGS